MSSGLLYAPGARTPDDQAIASLRWLSPSLTPMQRRGDRHARALTGRGACCRSRDQLAEQGGLTEMTEETVAFRLIEAHRWHSRSDGIRLSGRLSGEPGDRCYAGELVCVTITHP